MDRRARRSRTTLPLRTIAFLTLAVTTGCQSPIGRLAYQPRPVAGSHAEVTVREVTRGSNGGVVTLEITNRSSDLLEAFAGSRAAIRDSGGVVLQNLDAERFEAAVMTHGPWGMGFEDWSPVTPPVRLDPIAAGINLPPGGKAVVSVGFAAPSTATSITLDVGPALVWRAADGSQRRLDPSLPVGIPLPKVPAGIGGPERVFDRVHIGIGISNAGGYPLP
jgi:hypothetical protein